MKTTTNLPIADVLAEAIGPVTAAELAPGFHLSAERGNARWYDHGPFTGRVSEKYSQTPKVRVVVDPDDDAVHVIAFEGHGLLWEIRFASLVPRSVVAAAVAAGLS